MTSLCKPGFDRHTWDPPVFILWLALPRHQLWPSWASAFSWLSWWLHLCFPGCRDLTALTTPGLGHGPPNSFHEPDLSGAISGLCGDVHWHFQVNGTLGEKWDQMAQLFAKPRIASSIPKIVCKNVTLVPRVNEKLPVMKQLTYNCIASVESWKGAASPVLCWRSSY